MQYFLGFAALLAAPVSSTFVVQCYSRLFDQRADPVVNPGVASGHVHTITGGSGFNFSMTYDDARASQCSTCNIKQDLSNYWTPKLYYKAQNGSFHDVPIIGDTDGGQLGGMAVYYLTRPGPDNDKLTAFPKNFRMLAGDPMKRNETDDFAARAVSYKCVSATNDKADIRHLPTDKCDQIRAQVTFPACWDGKNTDSEDHKSHVSYPEEGNYDGGRCPKTHPVHLVTLFSEVYYDTRGFKDMWYGDQQPFVLANGDATGYGYHGDFVNGWDVDALQKGLDSCPDGVEDCAQKVFGDFNSPDETKECKLPSMIDEPVVGVLDALPGCNEVSYGPEPATKPAKCDAPTLESTLSPKLAGYVDVTAKGFKYIGCGKDNALTRTLGEQLLTGDDMTVEKCIDFCKGYGLKYAGLEYAGQCYCGSAVAEDRAPESARGAGNCLMKCAGNQDEVCGGNDAISLYEACSGGTCTNAAKRQSRRLASVEVARADAVARVL